MQTYYTHVQLPVVTRRRSHSWFHLFDAMNRHQRFPNDEAICPRPAPSWLPSIMSTAPLFEHQSPTGSHATPQTHSFRFSYWLCRFISERHGSESANQLTSGPGTPLFIHTKWRIWSVWMLPWQPAHSVFSRWRFQQYFTFQILPLAHHTEALNLQKRSGFLTWDAVLSSPLHLQVMMLEYRRGRRAPAAFTASRGCVGWPDRDGGPHSAEPANNTDSPCPKGRMASN